MSMLIVGTGALACLFAARLAGVGRDVTMMGNWPDGLAALRRDGTCLHDLDGSVRKFRVNVMDGTESRGSFGSALVLVKSWQTQRSAIQIKNCLALDGVALTLQNGLGNDGILREYLGAERVASGVTTLGARMLEPGHVQLTGIGKVTLGMHPHLGEFVELFKTAGFQVEVIPDLLALQWGKLVINAAINPLTALLRVPNGELLQRPTARTLMTEAAQEAARVAIEMGIRLPYDDPVQAVEGVARNTAANTSSMLQDVLRGTPTEIDAINGAIIQAGEGLGLPVSLTRVLYRLVKSLDG